MRLLFGSDPFQCRWSFDVMKTLSLLCAALCLTVCVGCQATAPMAACDEAGICEPVIIESAAADDVSGDDAQVRLAHFPTFSSRRHHGHSASDSIGELIVSQVEPIGPPNIVGTELHEQQSLASERALRLQEENHQLRVAIQTLEGENAAIRDKFATTTDLLERMSAALNNAQQTLETAERTNQQLKHEMAALEIRRQREQLAAEQELQSIRQELDDVLKDEIVLTRE
ncbi:MAG: hypothetical protein AAFU85_19700 [Planctomycetota bacterium]